MSIAEDFEQNGFISEVEVLPMDRTEYYSEKCKTFIDSYRSHPAFSVWTYYRTELVLKWVADLDPVALKNYDAALRRQSKRYSEVRNK